jgi:cell division protein FtsL
MINDDKWINSLPKMTSQVVQEKNKLNDDKWVNTISKPNTNYSVKKYSLITVLFVSGLLLVSFVKNETRNLQSKIDNLRASIKEIKFNLDQATLDNEVLNSPENISGLARDHLNLNLQTYKKFQVQKLGSDKKDFVKLNKENKNLKKDIKLAVVKKIEKKKEEIKKLQDLYSKPKEIPNAVRTEVAKKIEEKKIELKDIYESPKNVVFNKKAQRWVAIQVVKVFLGIPVVPGK